MHRIDTPGSVDGKFTVSNPQSGQRATQLGDAWPNAVQEEIVSVIAAAGIELDKDQHGQLLQAITHLLADAVGGSGDAVPITRVINTAGLLTGGGPLSANLNLNVPKASGLEVTAGSDDGKAITPAALAAHVGTAANIFRIGSRIFMVGTASALANTTTVVNLPFNFPAACDHADCAGGSTDSDAQDNDPFVSGRGVGAITIFSARDNAVPVTWFAIGR